MGYIIYGVSYVASPYAVTNIRGNPQVAIIYLDAAARKGCRIWGQAEVLT